MISPFIVSNDIAISLARWGERKGFQIPEASFFAQLRSEFRSYLESIFPWVKIIEEAEMLDGIASLLPEDSVVLSLDKNYCTQATFSLDVTRLVDIGCCGEFVDAGLGKRPDAPSLTMQLDLLKREEIKEVVLVDDVIFSGSVIQEVIEMLAVAGIEVSFVVAGIAIEDGARRVESFGKTVKAVKRYAHVIDEICERDFYPGVPYSGRTLKGEANIGIPYILPYGEPTKWASIPEKSAIDFSRFCLRQTIRLFEQIEKLSEREVICEDIERKICLHWSGRFVDRLQDDLNTL